MNYLLTFQLNHGETEVFLVIQPDEELEKQIIRAHKQPSRHGAALKKLCFEGDSETFIHNPDSIFVSGNVHFLSF